ncbi:sensor histidine kinase [Streptomyces sp. NPDC056465]|uniref:sensor histidine kinase n=1 Tax=Streptomyces sp. NPDC056465 TaxID=3345829 RepID=UPI00368EF55F
MWVWGQVRRWKGRSGYDKIDLYTRGTLHTLTWMSLVCPVLLSVTRPVRHSGAPVALIAGTLLAGIAQGVCSVRLMGGSLESYLGRRPLGRTWPALGAGLMLANTAGLLALGTYTGPEKFPELTLALAAATMPLFASLALITPVWVSSGALAVLAAAMSGGVRLTGGSAPLVLQTFLGVCFSAGLFAVTARLSAWTLDVMAKLRDAQDVETRLAVAEERLRFGRDMHDVLGRNLAVIALKSELAVELAQRGKPTALDQMVEVQRIARASQQEVRDVVRGYREADLGTELLGAQGVLKAAGISVAVHGDGGQQLPSAVQSALGWAVREAATNVLRHGDPQRCAIRLETGRDEVRLVVENDGVTPGRTVLPGGGSGLTGLRERLAAVGGSLEAGPTGDGLFHLTAEVPLPPPRKPAHPPLET